MIVRQLADILGTQHDVKAETWNSRRLLLAGDGCGFSFHDTLIHAGTETLIWYQHHLEAVYCIEGEGSLETTDNGTVYEIGPGTLYVLNGNERHLLRARKTMRMICVFSPGIRGDEVHDKDGVYPPPES